VSREEPISKPKTTTVATLGTMTGVIESEEELDGELLYGIYI